MIARFAFPARFLPLIKSRISRILEVMEVHFSPEQEAQIAQLATKAGTNAEHLVKDAVLRLLEEETHFPPPCPNCRSCTLGL